MSETIDHPEIVRVVHAPASQQKPKANGHAPEVVGKISVDDFYAYLPDHNYIFIPTRAHWPGASVDAKLPSMGPKVSATEWLDQNRSVEQMTWAPGLPMLIKNKLMLDGGWIDSPHSCFNLYQPPSLKHGDKTQAAPWIEHLATIYPEDADHITKYLAHRVQRPQEKINHALLLGGKPGIGKDTVLEPVKQAIGPWNFKEASPQQILGRFNGFLKCVILRISEAKDLGEFDRFAFYDHMKTITASPPDVHRIDEKYVSEYAILNCCGVILTTNHKTNGIYLPADDRRTSVAWSESVQEDFSPAYFNKLWAWYENGGFGHVAAYLATFDLSGFNPKAPPKKTPAFWAMVNATRPPETALLADLIDAMHSPNAFILDQLKRENMPAELMEFLTEHAHRRHVPHRLEECNYVAVHNPDAADGMWKISGKRKTVYAKSELSTSEQYAAVTALKRELEG